MHNDKKRKKRKKKNWAYTWANLTLVGFPAVYRIPENRKKKLSGYFVNNRPYIGLYQYKRFDVIPAGSSVDGFAEEASIWIYSSLIK